MSVLMSIILFFAGFVLIERGHWIMGACVLYMCFFR